MFLRRDRFCHYTCYFIWSIQYISQHKILHVGHQNNNKWLNVESGSNRVNDQLRHLSIQQAYGWKSGQHHGQQKAWLLKQIGGEWLFLCCLCEYRSRHTGISVFSNILSCSSPFLRRAHKYTGESEAWDQHAGSAIHPAPLRAFWEFGILLKGPAEMWLLCQAGNLNWKPSDYRQRGLTCWTAQRPLRGLVGWSPGADKWTSLQPSSFF